MRSGRRGGLHPGRPTRLLAAVAGAATGAVIFGEYGRVWRRGSAPLPAQTPAPLQAAAEAAVETAEVARAGYREVPAHENALFNLLAAFTATSITARGITTLLRTRRSVGPFRNLRVGRRHVHHFVPGIAIAFISGSAAIATADERVEGLLAVPFGAGMALTLDEAALLLELDDVYWSEEGIVSVQVSLAAATLLAALALARRFLRRGETLVLEDGSDAG